MAKCSSDRIISFTPPVLPQALQGPGCPMTSILGKQVLNREGELGPQCFSPPPTLFPLDINQDGEDPNFRVRPGLLFLFTSLRSRISRFPFLDEQGCPLPPPWWGTPCWRSAVHKPRVVLALCFHIWPGNACPSALAPLAPKYVRSLLTLNCLFTKKQSCFSSHLKQCYLSPHVHCLLCEKCMWAETSTGEVLS